MNENPYMMLAKVILPSEMTEYFDLVKVRTDEYSGEPRLHLYRRTRIFPWQVHTDPHDSINKGVNTYPYILQTL